MSWNKHLPAFPIFNSMGETYNERKDESLSGFTKREIAAMTFTASLLSKYNLSSPDDQKIVCQLGIELADELFKQLGDE